MKSTQTQTIVIASGYFNPLHSGHISYLDEARKLGDKLLVIINNDLQVKLKGSKEFLDQNEAHLAQEINKVQSSSQILSKL